MFQDLEQKSADLVLLHHTWKELSIAQALQQLTGARDGTRVIVFTGRQVDTRELIECVRFGVADYWDKRGQLETERMLNQIMHYCAADTWKMANLRMSSGSLIKLIKDSEFRLKDAGRIEVENNALKLQNRDLHSAERAEMLRGMIGFAKWVGYMGVAVGAYWILVTQSELGAFYSALMVAALAVIYLFAESKLTRCGLRWGQSGGEVKAGK